MKTLRMLSLTLAALTLTATLAAAQTCTPRIDRREVRQWGRIHQGVRSGELTRGEARRLRTGERRIERTEYRAKVDGVVSMRERGHLARMENRESARIWRLKHNDAVR